MSLRTFLGISPLNIAAFEDEQSEFGFPAFMQTWPWVFGVTFDGGGGGGGEIGGGEIGDDVWNNVESEEDEFSFFLSLLLFM